VPLLWESQLDLKPQGLPVQLPSFHHVLSSRGAEALADRRRGSLALRGIKVGAAAFVVSALLAWPSQAAMRHWAAYLALPLLLAIVLTGILFDVVGVAATRASEIPFHARSAKGLPGARQAIRMVRQADKVALFCSDVVGDLAGTLSGAAAVAVAVHLFVGGSRALWAGMLAVAAVTALTIGGKAVGKAYAIRRANAVVGRVARALAWAERLLGREILVGAPKGRWKG
jgi:CBS domain containing-hemolysin-like protein